MAFLNPQRVERQGGQNQLYERSTEKGFSKENLEEETEGKNLAWIFWNWEHFSRAQKASPKAFKTTRRYVAKEKISPKQKMNGRVRG